MQQNQHNVLSYNIINNFQFCKLKVGPLNTVQVSDRVKEECVRFNIESWMNVWLPK